MRYSVGTCLADFGFGFFEKLHEPIFLINRLGKVSKVNEAGRKFLRIAHLNLTDVSTYCAEQTRGVFNRQRDGYKRLRFGRMNVIAHSLPDSDFILVEVKR